MDDDPTTPDSDMTNRSTMSPAEIVFQVKDPVMRAVVGVSCCLSILGSLLIILSYILFKKRRTRAREILLHISLMDLGVALANLIGLSVYFDKYYYKHHEHVAAHIDRLCRTQAFFAAYCTMGSILWTIALAAFLYFVIIHHRKKQASYFVWAAYLVCYGFPFFLTLWLIFTKRLGHSPMDSSGWCTLITDDMQTGKVDVFVTIIAYDLWIYLAIVTIPLFYLAIRCHLANQVKDVEELISPERFWSSLHHVDYKFLIIPVVFVFLRVWTIILSILYDYVQLDVKQVPSKLNLALLYLSGIGDSSQGFANAILFVIFTKNIRDGFIKYLCCGKKFNDGNNDLEADGQIQNTRSNQSSRLSLISGDSKRGSPVPATNENSQDDEEEEREKMSLRSGTSLKGEQSNRYGAVS